MAAQYIGETMMNFTIITCIVIALTQTVYIIMSPDAIHLYNVILQPFVYTALVVVIYTSLGRDARPITESHSSNMFAILSVIAFGITILAVTVLFGAGANAMTANPSVIVNTLWTRGFIVVVGEFIRYKLIKTAKFHNFTFTIIALTIALSYGQMSAVRMLINDDALRWAVFFEVIFKYLVISSVASYFALKGSILSVIVISFVYTMAPYLFPVLPDISPIAFTLISCALLFAIVISYRFATNEKKCTQRIREMRAQRYAKKSITGYGVTAVIIFMIIVFFMGAFPFYPVVALSGSMEPTIRRGSIVIINKVPADEVFNRVGEGEVIHFISRSGAEYIHRVVDFRFDSNGERVYITHGDASYLVDPFPVKQNDVMGVARASMPFLGYPYIFIHGILHEIRRHT